jgi:uncharacterized repeat protein (TIGR03803 family)
MKKLSAMSAALTLAVGFLVAAPAARAQTFTVLYTFTNTDNGYQPDAGLFRDAAGNLYGTTQFGGIAGGFGTVFKLAPDGAENVLYSFAGTPDAEDPYAGLIRDKEGNFYGTTIFGGTAGGFGSIFKLDSTGKETVLYSFAGTPDGADPYGGLVRDAAGNLYGTTIFGGTAGGFGTVFKLDPSGKLTLLHSFAGTPDGEDPYGGLVLDTAGNLYGTTRYGGKAGGFGTVFKVTRSGHLMLLHSFSGTPDGEDPEAGLIRDAGGNLYGTTIYGGTAGGFGTVFKLDTGGVIALLHSFAGDPDGVNPYDRLVRDGAGNLYGTTFFGGDAGGYGTVFKLEAGGKLVLLHSFAGTSDGASPTGGLILDQTGTVYGTASAAGDLNCGFFGCGTVFKVTP